MKKSKPQSLTTDTHLSQSNFFNNSFLNKTNLTSSSRKPKNHITNDFQQYDRKESDFLKVKRNHLEERVRRMANQIKQLEENKIDLLKLNEKYVKVVNQYYRNSQIPQKVASLKSKSRQKASQEKPKFHSKCFDSDKQGSDSLSEVVLGELQKDYRNLVKHCLVMEHEIENYAKQMQKFNQMKSELYAVNHASPKELILELQETTNQNKELKKQNNRLGYELEKSISECNRLRQFKENQQKDLSARGQETQKLKAQILKVTQESTDKSSQYEQRIYELDLKVEKLEKELRSGQMFVFRNEEKRKEIEVDRVQDTHENNFLKANLSQLLDKKSSLMRVERGSLAKANGKGLKNQNRQNRYLSLNKTFVNG